MASVFKRKYTKLIDGKRVRKQSQKWHTKLRDSDGIVRTIPLYRDKIASQQRAVQLQTEIERGYSDRYKEYRNKPLDEHLREFKQALIDKGDTKDHAQRTFSRTQAIFKGCGFVFTADVQPSRVQGYIADRRRAGLGAKTCNYYLVAAKSFFNWMVNDRRTAENPLAYLKGRNARKDIRRQRRALTMDEIDVLLTATLLGPQHHNLTGKDRYMLYTLALSTGLRAGELSSLSWRSLDLSDSEPSITVLAGYAKNGREATLPLRLDVAEQFRQWFSEAGFSLDCRVFPRFNKCKGAAMLRQDLQAAGIAYEDDAGRYADFHSLRHTFISNVGKSGATVKEAQSLARHSTSALTLDVYTHIGLHDERQAVENLPELHRTDQPSRAVALKTGTDNRPLEPTENCPKKLTPKLTPFLTPTAYPECNPSATIGNQQDDSEGKDTFANAGIDKHLDNENDCLSAIGIGENRMGRGGFEPPTQGFSVPCSTN